MPKQIEPEVADGFILLRYHHGEWTVLPTKLFKTYHEAMTWASPMALVGRKVIVPVKILVEREGM